MTTGGGIAGSTIGAGSNEGEESSKRGDFKGSTPREGAYRDGSRRRSQRETRIGGRERGSGAR